MASDEITGGPSGTPRVPGGPADAPVPAPERMEPVKAPRSALTVVAAALAGLGLAAAKAVAGVVSGSSAMLSEAAHSVAGAVTDVLLLTALRRSAGPADEEHPLGRGPERYVWAMLASVAVFAGAAVFAVHDGVRTLVRGGDLGDPLPSYIVLAVAALLEGCSLWTGVRQLRGEGARFGPPARRYLRYTPDTPVRAVAMEDAAAVSGLLLAAGGLAGAQLTGSPVWDGIASILIGLLLGYVAWVLGRHNARLLVGRPLPPRMRRAVHEELLTVPHIVEVLELTTLVQGPAGILIAAKVNFRDVASAEQVEWACDDAEEQLRQRFPAIRRVYLDPTPAVHRTRPAPDAGPPGLDEHSPGPDEDPPGPDAGPTGTR
ncbi:cation diffusion facilitator family transporter [Streptomyces sp. ICN441]|uniref:cation diffusion facilitator family transporter n=1 Tax=Streptomyces sp. ICN441 TaxID=2558286 RepID=UPI00106CC3E1|nr:cation diffusion facilitator family transporter [Streptomyces sp. ICN441]TFE52369.1 cation diffusion facilitator family transporter [Streptomyces sp. ICN441]